MECFINVCYAMVRDIALMLTHVAAMSTVCVYQAGEDLPVTI